MMSFNESRRSVILHLGAGEIDELYGHRQSFSNLAGLVAVYLTVC